MNVDSDNSFRLLTEYHSFLLHTSMDIKNMDMKFPSPYGVSFILIILGEIKGIEIQALCKFPSPYGVSFILI